MKRACYQYGTVELCSRSHGPAVWVYRWRECGPEGRSVRKSLVLGTAEKLKSKTQALKAAEGYRLKINHESAGTRQVTFGSLIERFIVDERIRESKGQTRAIGVTESDEAFDAGALDFSTASSYLSMIDVHLRPKWEKYLISAVKPALVQEWLRDLACAPKTKGHIKALMHRLFEKSMLWELTPLQRNPMQLVHIKGISKRTKQPVVLTVDECHSLISLLPEPYCTMAIVAICLGLRISEILALRWSRIDFERKTMLVKLKVVNGRMGKVKTECSDDELPLDAEVATRLLVWKSQCRPTAGDWVFPSPITDRCYHASPIQQDYIRPAGEQIGVDGVGWHTFRHTYRSWLDATGAPVGVQQKLMRHAQVSTTMNVYGNALMESKRDANSKVVRMAFQTTEQPTEVLIQ